MSCVNLSRRFRAGPTASAGGIADPSNADLIFKMYPEATGSVVTDHSQYANHGSITTDGPVIEVGTGPNGTDCFRFTRVANSQGRIQFPNPFTAHYAESTPISLHFWVKQDTAYSSDVRTIWSCMDTGLVSGRGINWRHWFSPNTHSIIMNSPFGGSGGGLFQQPSPTAWKLFSLETQVTGVGGKNWYLYENGVQIGTFDENVGDMYNFADVNGMAFGALAAATGAEWTGRLGPAYFFKRILTPEEKTELIADVPYFG